MISPVVDSVLDSFLFGWLWIQFVSHHEAAAFYVQGYEVILEYGNKAGYQKAWVRTQKFQWFLVDLVLSASGASRAKQETSTVRPHAWEMHLFDDGWLLLAVRDTVVPSTQDKIIHASQCLDLFYHNQIWGPHMESLLTFLPFSSNWPAQPLSSGVPSPGLSHSILLPWSSRPPDHLPQSSQNSLLQWPVSMLTFFVPTQLRLCGRVCEALSASSLSHCVLLAGHLLSLQVLIARPFCPLSLWNPLPTSPSACPLGSKGASFLNTDFILHHFPLHDLKLWWSSNSLTSSAPFAVPAFPSRGQDMVHTAEHCLLVMVLALESHQLEPGGSDSLRAMTTSLAEALRILTNGVM